MLLRPQLYLIRTVIATSRPGKNVYKNQIDPYYLRMVKNKCWAVFLCIFIFIIAPDVAAVSDLEREKQIADKLVKQLHAGEAIWLRDNKTEFLGLFTETFLSRRQNAILLLHGMGGHPDWPEVISPLRWDLPVKQLPVLSIQLPILSPDSPVSNYGKTTKEASKRINIAVDYLYELGFKRVILVGYSFGAALGAYYLAHRKNHKVSAFVAISILARKFLDPTLNLKFLLSKINIPMLDIYAADDYEEIIKAIPDRRLAAHKSGNGTFSQYEIPDANHIYSDHTDELIRVIVDWIEQNPEISDEKI